MTITIQEHKASAGCYDNYMVKTMFTIPCSLEALGATLFGGKKRNEV